MRMLAYYLYALGSLFLLAGTIVVFVQQGWR